MAGTAVGSREVEDRASVVVIGHGIEFELDGGKGAEQQAMDVGEHGGTARGDAILDDQGSELREECIDLDRGHEFVETRGEGGGKVVGRWQKGRVAGAATGGGIDGVETAPAAGGRLVVAAGYGCELRAGVRQGHGALLWCCLILRMGGVYPRCFGARAWIVLKAMVLAGSGDGEEWGSEQ
jgi:hypothetical protein